MKILLFGKLCNDFGITEFYINSKNIKNEKVTFNDVLNEINKRINLETYKNLMYGLNHEYLYVKDYNNTIVSEDDIIAIIPPINAG